MKAGDIIEAHSVGKILFGFLRFGTDEEGYFMHREIREPKPGIHQYLIIETYNVETKERTKINVLSQFFRLFYYKLFKGAAAKKVEETRNKR